MCTPIFINIKKNTIKNKIKTIFLHEFNAQKMNKIQKLLTSKNS